MVRALTSHQCGSGLIPGLDTICGLSLLLVLFSTPRGFSPGTPVSPSPQKPTFPNLIRSGFQWTNSHSVEVPLKIPIIITISNFSSSFNWLNVLYYYRSSHILSNSFHVTCVQAQSLALWSHNSVIPFLTCAIFDSNVYLSVSIIDSSPLWLFRANETKEPPDKLNRSQLAGGSPVHHVHESAVDAL